jgi:hypothetical protein
MTFPEDPNLERRVRIEDTYRSNTGMWIAGAAAIMLVLGLIAYTASDNTNVASNDRSAASSTTGSGASSVRPRESNIPANPAGTTPQKEQNIPPQRQ